jgi:hypothetical protein
MEESVLTQWKKNLKPCPESVDHYSWGWDVGAGAETNFAIYLGEGNAGVTSWLGRFDSYHVSGFGFTASYFYGGDWHGVSVGASTDGFGFSRQINEYHSLTGN